MYKTNQFDLVNSINLNDDKNIIRLWSRYLNKKKCIRLRINVCKILPTLVIWGQYNEKPGMIETHIPIRCRILHSLNGRDVI